MLRTKKHESLVSLVIRTTILAAIASLCSVANAISVGSYTLHNHPDGNAAAPLYGLRLDDLLGEGIYTFDFDATEQGASMQMEFTDSSLHIYGYAWGGLDTGDSYASPTLWQIDMTYSVLVNLDNGGQVDIAADSGVGMISQSDSELTFNLVSYAGGHDHALYLGDEDGSGHRGFDGVSGWGWVNYFLDGGDPAVHAYSSDFLFTAAPAQVPVPAAIWLFGSALLGFLMVRRNGE